MHRKPALALVVLVLALVVCVPAALLARSTDEKPADQKTPPQELKYDVVVTATRVETPNKEVASSILVLTRADLERSRKIFVLEALQELAGVTIQENGPRGAAATVMLRGANSEHTLVLMDGVELNDPASPSRSFDFGHLLVDDIERVEVLLGPQSPLYGSDALGGVINIITRRGASRPGLSFSGLGGSYGTASGALAVRGGNDRWDYSVGASYFGSAGFSAAGAGYPGNTEKDGYHDLSLSGRLGYRLRDHIDFDLVVRNTSARTDLDSFGGASGDDPNSRQDYDLFFVRGQVRALLLKNRWEQRLALSYVSHHRSYDNPTDTLHPFDSETGTYDGRSAGLDWQNTIYAHESSIITAGVEAQLEDGRSDYLSEGAWGPSESLFPRKRARTVGVYAQDQVRLGGRFFAAVGGRLDDHDRFGTAFTYRIAPAYLFPGLGTKLKATLGTGFKSPSLYQLYAPGTIWGPIGNPDLRPETSTGWDAGVEQTLWGDRLSLGATYFHNDFRDLIQFDFLRGYTNTGQAEAKGWEAFASARPADGFLIQACYTRTDSRDEVTGLNLLRRPRDKFTAGLTAPVLPKTQLVLSLIAVGPRDDMAYIGYTASRVVLRGYTLLNAVISRDLGRLGRVFLRLDNILDQSYETVYGYGTARFSIYAGFSLGVGSPSTATD
jgi:vitamin B12 transporter